MRVSTLELNNTVFSSASVTNSEVNSGGFQSLITALANQKMTEVSNANTLGTTKNEKINLIALLEGKGQADVMTKQLTSDKATNLMESLAVLHPDLQQALQEVQQAIVFANSEQTVDKGNLLDKLHVVLKSLSQLGSEEIVKPPRLSEILKASKDLIELSYYVPLTYDEMNSIATIKEDIKQLLSNLKQVYIELEVTRDGNYKKQETENQDVKTVQTADMTVKDNSLVTNLAFTNRVGNEIDEDINHAAVTNQSIVAKAERTSNQELTRLSNNEEVQGNEQKMVAGSPEPIKQTGQISDDIKEKADQNKTYDKHLLQREDLIGNAGVENEVPTDDLLTKSAQRIQNVNRYDTLHQLSISQNKGINLENQLGLTSFQFSDNVIELKNNIAMKNITTSSEGLIDNTRVPLKQTSESSQNNNQSNQHQNQQQSQQEVINLEVARSLSSDKEAVARSFIRDFSNLLAKANLQFGQKSTKLLVNLYPKELGAIRVELLQTNGVLTARLLATTSKVKEMLEQQMTNLRQAFVQQNITIDKIDVTFSPDELSKYTEQREEEQQGQQHSQQNEDKKEHSNQLNFRDALHDFFEMEV